MKVIHIISFYLHLITVSAGVLGWVSGFERDRESETERHRDREKGEEREKNYLCIPGKFASCEETF